MAQQSNRPEDDLTVRTARTFGGFAAQDFQALPKSNSIPGSAMSVSSALPAINVFRIAPIAWNNAGRKEAFRVENLTPNLRRAVAVPFVPNRVIYAVPFPQMGLSTVTEND